MTAVHLLGVLENRFDADGVAGHEIVFLFEATFADPALYARDHFDGDEEGSPLTMVWRDLGDRCAPLYPGGLMESLTGPPSDQTAPYRSRL